MTRPFKPGSKVRGVANSITPSQSRRNITKILDTLSKAYPTSKIELFAPTLFTAGEAWPDPTTFIRSTRPYPPHSTPKRKKAKPQCSCVSACCFDPVAVRSLCRCSDCPCLRGATACVHQAMTYPR